MEVYLGTTPRVWSKLAEALKGGALPLLEHLKARAHDQTDSDEDLVADMVEGRAQILGCHRLTLFKGDYAWLGGGNPGEIRLLRALLPSLKSFSGGVYWHAAFDPCFCDICPPHLEIFDVEAGDDAFPSLEPLEAAPALKEIRISGEEMGAVAFQPVIAALHRGVGLRFLQEIGLNSCTLGDGHFCDFLQALKGSGCAERMLTLSFLDCGIGVDGARALANLLRADGLPALENLMLGVNRNIGDEGAVALGGGLIEAPRTMLKELDLRVGMGDVGMAALASVIDQGRMGQIRKIELGYSMTDKGLIALAQAIEARGLPKVQELNINIWEPENYTAVGFGALTLASVNGCPKMDRIPLALPDGGQKKFFLK